MSYETSDSPPFARHCGDNVTKALHGCNQSTSGMRTVKGLESLNLNWDSSPQKMVT